MLLFLIMTGPGCPSPLHAKPCRVHSLCLCYPSLALGWEFASSPLVTRCSLQPLGGDLEKPLTNFHTPWHTELALSKLSHTWRSQGWLLGGPTEQSFCAPLIPLPSPDLKGRSADIQPCSPSQIQPSVLWTPRIWDLPILYERN